VREGYPKRLRKITISGNRNTQERVIRREIGLHPGDPVDMVELERSLYRLDGLQYFNDSRGVSSVKSRFRSVEGKPEEVDLEIDLREGRTGNLFLSAGVSTTLGFIGRFSIRRRNFDILRLPEGGSPAGWISQILEGRAFYGGGQSLNLDISPGSRLSYFNISFTEPDILGRHEEPISLDLRLFKRLRFYREYLQDSLGGGFRLGRRFGRRTRLSLGFTAETVEVRDIEADAPRTVWDDEGSDEIRTLDLSFRHDATDHPIQPSRGYEVTLRPEVAGGFLGGSERFWGIHWGGKGYLPLFRDGMGRPHLLALDLGFDWRDPIGDDAGLHVAKRLFLGGRGTLRGFRFRGAGPTQFGNPTGGEARWHATLEYLLPVFSIQPERGGRQIDMVRLVFFADAGALGSTISADDFREIRLAMGAGLRIKIPGLSNIPLALDFGFPIRREATDEREVFSFRLGMF
jgi:outer membrane protein insertion porin family